MQKNELQKSRNVREGYYSGGSPGRKHQRSSGFNNGAQFVHVHRRMPTYVHDAIIALSKLWDELRGEPNPFQNTGGGTAYDFGDVKVEAYDWLDRRRPYNLQWRNLRVRWYKYAGRGMSMNRPATEAEVAEMLRECREAFSRASHPV